MGVERNVGHDVFPNQSNVVGQAVEIVRITETGAETVSGTIVRDDVVDPYVCIVELEDGCVVFDDEREGFLEPPQGTFRNRMASVIYNHDSTRRSVGKIVRDDMEEPFSTVIKLDVGHFVLGRECQYSPMRD